MDTETIMNFLADNYKWFMIGAGVLLFALIGFAVGGKKKKENPDTGVTMNQADFSQMGTMQQAQAAAQQTPQFIQNPAPAQVAPTPVAPAPVAPAPGPVAASPTNDTIFTGAPVSSSEPAEEKLVIEAPTGTLNENINMDTLGSEAKQELLPPEEVVPAAPTTPTGDEQLVFETPVVEAPAQPAPVMETMAPEMAAAPTPEMVAQPVMESVVPDTDIPVSMVPEEPIMQAPPTPVAPAPVQAPAAPVEAAPMYQNTIQQ